MRNNIIIKDKKEEILVKELEQRKDVKAERIKRLLNLPDLSRQEGSPLKAIVNKVLEIKDLEHLDNIFIPEIVSTEVIFDLFGFSHDHPARSESDTYYVNSDYVLRTHDTVFWYYYLNHPEIREKISKKRPFGTFCYGKVYRKDEIDRTHMNVFHQMGGLYLVPDSQRIIGLDDLKNVLALIVKSVFGQDINYRFLPETFPYTDPSIEVEIEIEGKWMEIVGSGLPKKEILSNFNLKGYNGWAFGFGLERLAMIKMGIPDIRILWSQDLRIKNQLKNLENKYREVSKYPPVERDISFIISKNVNLNNYYELIRDEGGDLIEEVKMIDSYENDEKFGKNKKSYTFHIVYRSLDRVLTNEEVNLIHQKITEKTIRDLNAIVR